MKYPTTLAKSKIGVLQMRTVNGNKYILPLFLAALIAGLLSACGAPTIPTQAAVSSQSQAVAVRITPATIGDISLTTAYAAMVEPGQLVALSSLSSGRVESLNVEVGSEIKKGQVIAELRHGTLDAQLQRAQANLEKAGAKLDSVRAGSEPNRIVAMAQLLAANATLEQLINPTSLDLQVSESAVANAQSNLDRANALLNQLLDPSSTDLRVAESAVAVAQSNLDGAGAKLDQLFNPSAADLEAAESAVAVAQSNLDSGQAILDQLLNPSPADIGAAENTVAAARSQLSTAQSQVNQAISKEQSGRWQLLLEARIRLQANTDTLSNPALSKGLTPAEIADAQEAIEANQEEISTLLQQLISSPLIPDDIKNSTALIPEEIRFALWAESQAQKALESASENLRELQEPSENTIAVAQNNVAIDQAAMDVATAMVLELVDPGQNTIAQAQFEVDGAQASLDAAVAKLERLKIPKPSGSNSGEGIGAQNPAPAQGSSSRHDIEAARADVDAAQASLDAAEALFSLLNNPRPADLATAEAGVAMAEQTLALAQEPYSLHDIQAAAADVDQAQAEVNLAENQLAELQIVAPFDGIVTEIFLARGAVASPQTPVVTVVSNDVIVFLRVEQTGIGSLQLGQLVEFTSPALPGQHLELQIDWIAPTGDQKAHTFSVQLSPLRPDTMLKPGMFGQVSILTRHENVVLVPKETASRQGGQFALFVVEDGRANLRDVDVGLIDEDNLEVLQGVRPGDQIVESGQNLLIEGSQVTIVSN